MGDPAAGAREGDTSTTRMVASILGGRALEDAPGGIARSTNPARTDEVVAEVLLGDAATFLRFAALRVGCSSFGPLFRLRSGRG